MSIKLVLALIAYSASTVVVSANPTFTPSSVTGAFVEQFDSTWNTRWSPSKATKDEVAGEQFSYVGQWSVEEAEVYPAISGDEGLVMKTKAAHHAISVPFSTPLDTDGKTLVVQYEVKLQKGLECGGAYIKLLTDSDIGIQAEEFSDKTPYTIMFGPDRCGSTAKVHFIFRHANPLTGEVEEKHLVAPPAPKTDLVSTLYTLIVRPDQSFEIKVNNESVKTGSLLTDFSPAVNPEAEIDDVNDTKPADWVESPKITDPEAVKPADWDEDAPQYIEDVDAVQPEDWLVDETATMPDPEAEKPEEWSDEDDGEWIAPSVSNPICETAVGCGPWSRPEITNPAYKGKWFAPLIDNPEYIGVWAAKKVKNPDYFEDLNPAKFNKMAGLGIELWTMTEDIMFNNIYIGHSEEDASKFAAETFLIKKPIEDALASDAAPTPPAAGSNSAEPDMKAQPVEWAKFKLQEFVDIAILDPVGAFKALPYTGAAAGVAFATILGFFGISPAPKKVVKKTKAAVAKKTDAVSADDEVVADETPVVVGEVKEEPSTRTRAGKGKAAQ